MGEPFGAILVSNDAKKLVYESWDKGGGLPSGVPTTIALDQIDGVAGVLNSSRDPPHILLAWGQVD